jgi:hypothetical protein
LFGVTGWMPAYTNETHSPHTLGVKALSRYIRTMADNVTNELLLETLKQLRTDVAEVREALKDNAAELRSVKHHIQGLVVADLSRESGFASLLVRIERIERRLELND